MEYELTASQLSFAKNLSKTFKLYKADAIGLASELVSVGVYTVKGDSFAEIVAEQNLPSLLSSDLSIIGGSDDRREFMEILYSLAWEGTTDRYFFSTEFGPETLNIIDLWRDAMMTILEIGKTSWRLPYTNSPEENMRMVKTLINRSLDANTELANDIADEEPTNEEDLELLLYRSK